MRILTLVVLSLFIMSCNNSAEKEEDLPAGEAGIKDTNQPGKQMPEKPVLPDTVFTGFGNEPFWSVYVIKDKKIVFHPADGPDVEVPYTPPATGAANSTQYNAVSGNNSIELVIVRKDCSDGMSEETHPYSISLLVNKTKYAGCGREGK